MRQFDHCLAARERLAGEAIERRHIGSSEAVQYLARLWCGKAINHETRYGREGGETLSKTRKRLRDVGNNGIRIPVVLQNMDGRSIVTDVVLVRERP
jgi:hypothetical protein